MDEVIVRIKCHLRHQQELGDVSLTDLFRAVGHSEQMTMPTLRYSDSRDEIFGALPAVILRNLARNRPDNEHSITEWIRLFEMLAPDNGDAADQERFGRLMLMLHASKVRVS